MSNGMIIFLAILGFILVDQAIKAVSGRSLTGRKATSAAEAVTAQLVVLEAGIKEIKDRLTSIEDVLQQVE